MVNCTSRIEASIGTVRSLNSLMRYLLYTGGGGVVVAILSTGETVFAVGGAGVIVSADFSPTFVGVVAVATSMGEVNTGEVITGAAGFVAGVGAEIGAGVAAGAETSAGMVGFATGTGSGAVAGTAVGTAIGAA